ncbi:DUF92 domain-containing protein [Paenibacillus wulumuqiensis]|uniref:DUF92 domain-containing protein n=1 Tax=Paenibacillus wulumuqiensis TaxID=1567107 RepID=UPI0006192DE0|nr:DUF92 domain-containing protein [Paenibacillus wulumuqiensis]
MDWLIGFVCAGLLAALGYHKHWLSTSGALAAMVMGTVYYGAGNLFWFGLLILFFISGSVLSRMKRERKRKIEQDYAKGSRRDAGQVFANGGLGMLLCIGNAIWPHPAWTLAFIGIMATVTADTWATEIGSLSRRPPRSVLNGRVLEPGASGGVSVRGTTAAVLAGLIIGLAAWLFATLSPLPTASSMAMESSWLNSGWLMLAAGLVGGLVGCFADSYLGATVQLMYRCEVCGKQVETRIHCGQPTVYDRGWRWMNNDMVNAVSSIMGGAAALLFLI